MRVRGTVVPSESGVSSWRWPRAAGLASWSTAPLCSTGSPTRRPPAAPTSSASPARSCWERSSSRPGGRWRSSSSTPVDEAMLSGVRVGFRTVDTDALLAGAVETAAAADVAVVFVGTTHEWETEGRDRTTLALPGRQDDLVRRVGGGEPAHGRGGERGRTGRPPVGRRRGRRRSSAGSAARRWRRRRRHPDRRVGAGRPAADHDPAAA